MSLKEKSYFLTIVIVVFFLIAALSWAETDQNQGFRYTRDASPEISYELLKQRELKDEGYIIKAGEHAISLTLDPELQQAAEHLLRLHAVPWGALVAIEPKTGKVLALAGHSTVEPDGENVATRATFPAASLFKLITASAAIEQAGLGADDSISFRGGNYTLSRSNYQPSARSDRRSMTLAAALGKSINPVFGRIALVELEKGTLETYANNYGFNVPVPFELPAEMSRFEVADDDFERARTGAGFGNVTISPLHAATITATIANRGQMMRPYLIDKVRDAQGNTEYTVTRRVFKHAVLPPTAAELLEAMKSTVTDGTAKRQFLALRNTKWGDVDIAAKTGTLSGQNPKGLYLWFVATAPVNDPKIAIAALVIDPGTARIKGSALGRKFLEQYFKSAMWEQE